MDIIEKMNSAQQNMTGKQKRISQYLLNHVVEVGYMSLKELSVQAQVSEVSVLKFCSLLGYENFIALREAFRDCVRKFMAETLMTVYSEQEKSTLTPQQRNELYRFSVAVAKNRNEMIQSVDMQKLDHCANTILNARNVLIFGHDMSKMAADYLAGRLNYMRIRAQSINPGDDDTVLNMLASLTDQDCVIFFSFHPYYYPICSIANYVQRCHATVISIADGADSPVVFDDSINFLCKAQTPVYFNALSVPFQFTELLGCYIALLMGEKFNDIIKEINTVDRYLTHNIKNEEESFDDQGL